MPTTAIRRPVVAGAGTMGVTLARIFAQAGYAVTLWNRRTSSLDRAQERIAGDLAVLQEKGLLDESPAAIAQRITYTTDFAVYDSADFVVENIAEDLEIKQAFYRTICQHVSPDTLLTTNTSGLRVSDIAQAVEHPERFCGMHFWNPPDLMPLVEITKGEQSGNAVAQAVHALALSLGKKPVIVSPEIRTGLTMGVPDPHAVGKDRIVDAAYAAANFPLPVITVDLGTATTFNVVDENRVFRGGVICPGLSTGLRALGERCAQLPQVHLSSPKNAIGTNTESCMLSGSVLGTAVLLDGIAARIEEELGRPATLVVTGGLAKYVTPLCRHPLTYDPELLLKGLALLYQLNAPQQHHHPAGGRKPHGQNFRRHRPFRRERHETEAKAG